MRGAAVAWLPAALLACRAAPRPAAAGLLTCAAAPAHPNLLRLLLCDHAVTLSRSATSISQVYLARNKETGQEVVIKMIERGPAVSKHVESELLIHRCACACCRCCCRCCC